MSTRTPVAARLIVFVIAIVVSFSSTLAQADSVIFEDPQGRFSTTIPATWSMALVKNGVQFTSGADVSLALLTVEAADVEAGFDAVINGISGESEPVLMASAEIPAPNGVWQQRVYTDAAGQMIVGFARQSEGVTYAIVIQSPDEAAFQAEGAAIESVIMGFTIGAAIDLSQSTPVVLTEPLLAEFEAYVEAALEGFNVPGAAVAIVQNGDVVYIGGFGELVMGSGEAVTPETLFMIGSITKPLTTTMMATFADDGLLDWDQPVIDILPGFAISDMASSPELRVRDLVNGSSGVPRRDLPSLMTAMTPQAMIALIAELPMVAPPGETFNYSNYMVATGGYVTTLLSGAQLDDDLLQAYADLMETRLFVPAGMTGTTLDFVSATQGANVAQPHTFDMLQGLYVPTAFENELVFQAAAPAGMVWSNVEDMARYALMILNNGAAENGVQVVSEGALAEILTANMPINETSGYGLGWYIEDFYGQRQVSHGGNMLGYSSKLTLLPDADLGIIILTNRLLADTLTDAVVRYALDLAFDLDHTSDPIWTSVESLINDRLHAAVDKSALVPALADTVTDFVGEYEHGIRIEVIDGQSVIVTGHAVLPLYTIENGDPNQFLAGGEFGGFRLTFTVDSEGTPSLHITSLFKEAIGETEIMELARLQ